MKRIPTIMALAMVLSLSAGANTVFAKSKQMKHSAEHLAAIRQCREEYKEAFKEAKLKRGKERKEAEALATKNRKECFARAPK